MREHVEQELKFYSNSMERYSRLNSAIRVSFWGGGRGGICPPLKKVLPPYVKQTFLIYSHMCFHVTPLYMRFATPCHFSEIYPGCHDFLHSICLVFVIEISPCVGYTLMSTHNNALSSSIKSTVITHVVGVQLVLNGTVSLAVGTSTSVQK